MRGMEATTETAIGRLIEALATVKNYEKHTTAPAEKQAENEAEYRRALRLCTFLYTRKRNRKGEQMHDVKELIIRGAGE